MKILCTRDLVCLLLNFKDNFIVVTALLTVIHNFTQRRESCYQIIGWGDKFNQKILYMDGTELKTRVGIKIQNITVFQKKDWYKNVYPVLKKFSTSFFCCWKRNNKSKNNLNHNSEHVDLCWFDIKEKLL